MCQKQPERGKPSLLLNIKGPQLRIHVTPSFALNPSHFQTSSLAPSSDFAAIPFLFR